MPVVVGIGLGLLVGLAGAGCRAAERAALCEGVSCGGHGTCVVVRREPTCACEEGYRPEGPNCLPLQPAAPAAGTTPAGPATLPPPPATEPLTDRDGGEPPPPDSVISAAQDLTLLCALALEALARPAEGERLDLATAAKREAIRRAAPALTEECTRFLLELAVAPEAVACATSALRRAADAGLDLGRLGAQDADVAACGARWKQTVEAGAEPFRGFVQRQRQAFGVAVFGFHRQYGFAGGPDEELCRRWLAAAPDAPPDLLRETAALDADWQERVAACRRELDAAPLGPLARWCLVDRADELRAARAADPCLPFAPETEGEALRGLVQRLLPPG